MSKPIHIHSARIGQALASPVRIRALNLLAQRAWTVKELSTELGESLALTSSHLKVLRACHLVEERKEGREVWCRVAGNEVIALLAALGKAATVLLPEMRELARIGKDDPFLIQGLSLSDLYEEIMAEKIDLLDLRPADEYLAGHLPKAKNYPFYDLADTELLGLVSGEKQVVAYCRGPWCHMAVRGVEHLNERRIKARRLAAGVLEWQAESLPLVVGDFP